MKAVVYEGVVGGVGDAAGKAEKTVKTASTVVKSAVKTGVKETVIGIAEDVGYQVFVEDKSLDEVDYGQAAKAGATAGVTAMADEVLDAVAPKKQVSTKNKKKTSQATGLIADAADGGPRPKADVLPEGKVKGTVGSAGKANVAAGNHAVGDAVAGGAKKQKVSGTVKTGSTGSISKNQQKVQSLTVDSILSSSPKNTSGQINKELNLQFFAEDINIKKKEQMINGMLLENVVRKNYENNNGLDKYQKASFWERITKRKVDINELYPNPLDDFTNPKIEPCEPAVSKYIKQINQTGKITVPIEVQKLANGGYEIVNGHHRWLAAIKTGLQKVPIKIKNYSN